MSASFIYSTLFHTCAYDLGNGRAGELSGLGLGSHDRNLPRTWEGNLWHVGWDRTCGCHRERIRQMASDAGLVSKPTKNSGIATCHFTHLSELNFCCTNSKITYKARIPHLLTSPIENWIPISKSDINTYTPALSRLHEHYKCTWTWIWTHLERIKNNQEIGSPVNLCKEKWGSCLEVTTNSPDEALTGNRLINRLMRDVGDEVSVLIFSVVPLRQIGASIDLQS